MKLNAHVIFEGLQTAFNVSMAGKPHDSDQFGRPRFVTDRQVQLEPGYTYVALCDRLPKRPSSVADICLVCLGGNPPTAYSNERCVRLTIEGYADVFSVFNTLTNLYDRYDDWDNSLLTAIEEGYDLAYMIKISEPFFGNPLLVTNRYFRYIAYSPQIDTDERLEEFRPETDGTVSLSRVSAGMKDSPVNMTERSPIAGHSLFDLMSVNLFNGSRYIGSCTVVYANESPLDGHRQLATHLARRIEMQLRRHPELRYSENDALRRSLSNLVAGYPVDPAEWKRSASAITRDSFVCVKALPQAGSHDMPADLLCHVFEENVDGCSAVTYSDAIVAIINTSRDEVENGSLEAEVRYVLDKASLKAGMSSPYGDLLDTRRYYRSASIALEKGSEQDPEDNMHLFDDFALPYMIEQCPGEFPADMVCTRGLERLVAHDDRTGSEYMKTLRMYLDNNMNVAKTARDLYIHRTSLQARIERVEMMLDADLSNPDERLRVSMSLRVLENS